MRHNYFDIFIKRKLNRVKPPQDGKEAMWEGIESALDADDNSRGRRRLRAAGLLAALLITTGGGTAWYMMQEQQDSSGTTQSTQAAHTAQQGIPGSEDLSMQAGTAADATGAANSSKILLSQAGSSRTSGDPYNEVSRPGGSTPSYNISGRGNSTPGNRGRNAIASGHESSASAGSNVTIGASAADNSRQEVAPKQTTLSLAAYELKEKDNALAIGPKYRDRPQEQDKSKKGMPAIASNWQSIYFQFWDNAAYTGAEARHSFNLVNNTQLLPDGGKGEHLSSIGYELQVPESKFSIGLYHRRDVKPLTTLTETGLSASYRLLQTGRGFLSLGGGANYMTKRLSSQNLRFSDQYDPASGNVYSTSERMFTSYRPVISLNAGLWYSSNRLTLGVSAQHINQPKFGHYLSNQGGSVVPRELDMVASYRFSVLKDLTLAPWLQASAGSGSFSANTLFMLDYKNRFMLGGGWKNLNRTNMKGEFSMYAGVQLRQNLRIFASYGRSMEWEALGVRKNIIHSGIRYQIK